MSTETLQAKVVSRDEWLAERQRLLADEKALTRQREAVAARRRALPWVKIEKEYAFEGARGRQTLGDLFDGRRQLIVYHFMLGPGWKEGCPSCSMWADGNAGVLPHLRQRDVTMAVVSRAPWPEIQAFQRRMEWPFTWVSSHGSDFNRDFGVSFSKEEVAARKPTYNFHTVPPHGEEVHGLSVFYRDPAGGLFHTYSSYTRGGEDWLGVYTYLDLVPAGRGEEGLPWPMAWVRHHDRYETGR